MARKKKQPIPANAITPADAAKILKLSHSRICLLCRDGRLPGAVLFSRVWLIPRAAVLEFSKTDRPSGNPNFVSKHKT